MSERNEGDFGRFALTVITLGVVILVLGGIAIFAYFQFGGQQKVPAALNAVVSPLRPTLLPNQAVLYYTRDGVSLVSVVTSLGKESMTAGDKATAILTRLLAGQDAASLRPATPQGTRLLSSFLNQKVLIVNVSREFLTNMQGGPQEELLAVYALVNSALINVEGVEAVQILVENERLPTLRGHVDIENPLIANLAVNQAQ